MAEALKLFWWAKKPNFGDTISQIVTAYASGRVVDWSKPEEAEIFAIGSIMNRVRGANASPHANGMRPVVWGTGCMKPVRTDFLPNVDVAMVRGPITASLLGIDVPGYGDPGLLVSDALGEDIAREDKIGLIPHLSQREDPAFRALVDAEPRLELIDVRDEATEVCRKIASCAHVVSSSLHGLIVADSYGVPNTWLNPVGIHAAPHLKFYDYAAGIERGMARPIELSDLPGKLAALPQGDLPYAEGLARSKSDLLTYFPAAHKAGATAA